MSSGSRFDTTGALVRTAPMDAGECYYRLGPQDRWPVWVPGLAIHNAFALATLGSLPPYCLRARCMRKNSHLAMEFVVQRKHAATVESLIRISERFKSITADSCEYRLLLLVIDTIDDDLFSSNGPELEGHKIRVYSGDRNWQKFYDARFPNISLEPLHRGTAWREYTSDHQSANNVDRQIGLIVQRRNSEFNSVTTLPYQEDELFFASAKFAFLDRIEAFLPRATVAAGFRLCDDDVHFIFQVTDFNENCVLNIAEIDYSLGVDDFDMCSHTFELKMVDRPEVSPDDGVCWLYIASGWS